MSRSARLRFTAWQKVFDPHMKREVEQIEAYFGRKGRFYGFVAIRRCTTPYTAYYLTTLFPGGGWDFDHLVNPVRTMKQARANARAVVEIIINDMQSLLLS